MKKIVFLFTALLILSIHTKAKNVVTPKGDKDIKTSELTNFNTTSLSGTVLDNVTGEALTGVAIRFEGSNKTVYTDFDGNFKIEDIVPGQYNILSNYISYADNKLKGVNLGSENNVIRLVLKKD